MDGTAATIRARGDLLLSLPLITSSEDLSGKLRAALLQSAGDPVRPNLATSGEVVVARDYESFSLLTLYHHVEAAERFLMAAGAEPSEIEALDVLYLPFAHLDVGDRTTELVDNFFYVHGARVLAALRLDVLGAVPLAQNEGIVTHEVGHALWDARVLSDEATFRRLLSDTEPEAINLLDAVSEGVSDFFGAVQSQDPDFIRHSVPVSLLAASRDVSVPAVLDEDWIDNANLSPAIYLPTVYRVGTTLASALWRASPDREATAAALVGALSDVGARVSAEPPWGGARRGFALVWILDAVLPRLDATAAASLCEIVRTDLTTLADEVTSCAL